MLDGLVGCLDEEGYDLGGSFSIWPIHNAYVGHFRELIQTDEALDHFISIMEAEFNTYLGSVAFALDEATKLINMASMASVLHSLLFLDFPTWMPLLLNQPTTEHGGPSSFSFDDKIEAMETLLNALQSFQLFQARPRWSVYATWLAQQLEMVKRQRTPTFQTRPVEPFDIVPPRTPW
ncbi:Zn(2)-C7 fungal-type transcription factor [Pseudohyphozyma bogoriensis]|nr:Zn(2)-C7 fungal-type transcription factor [Pseudohyphozyma bogoriensis]